MSHEVRLGDCVEQLRAMATASVDAVVTDPPAGIGFMGRHWDSDKGGRNQWVAWLTSVMAECVRVLKPGGHALVWALPRTSHWTATAVEDAGFEIRDVVLHLFGTGFPKSLNLGDGRGTALKPAAEHWILARKPIEGTVAANVLAHGTGALNIDASRINPGEQVPGGGKSARGNGGVYGDGIAPANAPSHSEGRWPANLILDEAAAAELDAQSGTLNSGTKQGGQYTRVVGVHDGGQRADGVACYGDSGGASRFFYIAKPTASERDNGIDHLRKRTAAELVNRAADSAGINNPRAGAGRTSRGRANGHPTVKPVELMRYLCKLVTPPGGIVLDPFCGSGTTGVAAVAEGFSFIGIEREPEYVELARARIEEDMPLFSRTRSR